MFPCRQAAARTASPAGRSNTSCSIEAASRPLARILAAALLLFSAPLHAQQRQTDPELEALIPDAAVAAPEDWAKASPTAPAPGEAAEPVPTSPLAEMPEITLPWPDEQFAMPALAALPPDPDLAEALTGQGDAPAAAAPVDLPGDVTKLNPQLALVFPTDLAAFPERHDFDSRFRSLSALVTLKGEGDDNLAQIAVRARADRDLLVRLLRIYGYYDGEVTQTIGGIEPGQERATARVNVRFDVVPGPRFGFGEIDLGDLRQTGEDYPLLRKHFGLMPGQPVHSDAIVAARDRLDLALGENGYTFGKVGEPDLLIDHLRAQGDLTVPVTPGGKYRYGPITSDQPRFLSGDHLSDIARFDAGDPYKRSEVDDLRRAILATGLVSAVTVTPRETRAPAAGQPGEVALDVTLAKAPLRTVAGALGYDSGDGFRVEASWEHRNLFPPEGLVRVRGIAGTKEQLIGATFRRNNFKGRDQVLTVDLYADTVNRTAYSARTVALTATFEKLTTLIFQKPWVWSAGFELLASNERERVVQGASNSRLTYLIAALPLRAAYDGSDDLLDPTRGFRAALRVSPELSRDAGQQHSYARILADASAYYPIGRKAVIAGRVRVGTIPGSAIANIAPSRRFYAGGGGSVRGFGYQLIGPRDAAGEPSGGRSLTEFSLEARIKTGLFDGALSVVPFVDAGNVDERVQPSFRNMRYGAGIGVRYQTGFGPIRVDLGTPLNRRPGESRIGVYVALGQAF
ncbi:MAG: BamA/TamA family outer membrane protein [Sphingomonadales bacterium]|nr:BamA/TamA family outer membrane protein [Sphingomonadales bacterium]